MTMQSTTIDGPRARLTAAWPSALLLALFLVNFWSPGYDDIAFYVAVHLCAVMLGFVGLVKLARRRSGTFSGVAYLVPAALFLFAMNANVFEPLRYELCRLRLQARFALDKDRYENEAKKLTAAGVEYKEWDWGHGEAHNAKLVFDARDRLASEVANRGGKRICNDIVYRIDAHFYVDDVYCSGIL